LEFSLQQYRLGRICDRKYHRRFILSGAISDTYVQTKNGMAMFRPRSHRLLL